MQRSTDAILTTHTGSLPRPDDLVELLYAAESGNGIDPAALHQRVRSAVAESVAQQLQTGVDIVDDGEMSKVSYSSFRVTPSGTPSSRRPRRGSSASRAPARSSTSARRSSRRISRT